jgi:adenine phosphoribosyltransferase
MTPDQIRALIRDVPDYPKAGITFKDITPLLRAPGALAHITEAFASRYRSQGITQILAPESRGFWFGAPLAAALGCGFIPVRKPGKLPPPTTGVSYDLEYGQDRLEIRDDALRPGDRALLIDDVLATGGTAAATAQLASSCGATLVEAAFLIDLAFLHGAQRLAPTPTFSLVQYA